MPDIPGIPTAIKDEIVAQGFPEYMITAFLNTAKESKSIVLSRVPGGVGTALIEEGYDLKGFHVKAKSCNWGPMAGFICQLPIFNKAGFSKLSYNTNEIGHYLKRLDAFAPQSDIIKHVKIWRDEEIKEIYENEFFTKKGRAEALQIVDEVYRKDLLAELVKSRKIEQTSGEWTGENTIEDPLPFIPLKRKLGTFDNIKAMRGVKTSKELILGKLVYITANNVTDEDDDSKNEPTVLAEFLLEKTDTDLWNIYHGRIFYKKLPTDPTFTIAFTGIANKGDIDDDIKTKYGELINPILSFSPDIYTPAIAEPILVDPTFIKLTTPPVFYKVNGIVNPFPPFAKKNKDGDDNKDYYKNAVSGDYDLFAIWPNMDISLDELTRQSEYSIGKNLRLGGKIFTTWLGSSKANLGIEYVPGFKELNPNKKIEGDELKESADFGNMTSLCHFVSQLLNSSAYAGTNKIIWEKKEGKDKATDQPENQVISSSKGFHSDEGGRPGIMEIEYPIAVFFPKKFSTKALNNGETGKKIEALSRRTELPETLAGLIKSPEELVAFMLECMGKDYRVMMHYAWITYLFYTTLNPDGGRVAFRLMVTPYVEDIRKCNASNDKFDFDKPSAFKDFDAIDKNKAIIDAKIIAPLDGIDLYIANLKKVIGAENDSGEYFTKLRALFLSYAFQSNKPSFNKKLEVEKIVIENPKVL